MLLVFLINGAAPSGEVERYFRFTIHQKSELDHLTRIISIDNVIGNTVYAYANEKEWKEFEKLGYRVTGLPHPSSLYEHEMSNNPLSLLDWDSYPTYQAYLTMMRQYATVYPSICRLDTIGFSIQNRLILALKISDSVSVREAEPQFLYTSSMHGDETVGYVLLLRLADYLLMNYGQSTAEGQRVSNLVNNMEIWINPLFNPDGTFRLGGDTTVSRATRGNTNGVDLNRDFPDRIDDSVNTTAGRQTETQAMMRWTRNHNFALSANFHGGAQVVNYPWDNGSPSGTYSMCPDDAWFIHLSRAYATPNPDLMSGGFTNGITNGCDWYAIFGGRQDWMYVWNGGREVTIELYNTKNPSGTLLPQRWNNNRESFLAFMEEGLRGVHGVVTDAATHAPLRARIDVQGTANVPVFSDSAVGDYHRLLLPGAYTLIVRATGYYPDTVQNVVVTDSVGARVDVALRSTSTNTDEPRSVLPAQFALLNNYPNPFNPTTQIGFRIGDFGFVSLKVFDLLGREVATLMNEVKEPGEYSVPWNADDAAGGMYFCRLSTAGFTQTRKLLLLR